MNSRNVMLGIGLAALSALSLAGCGGTNCADGSCDGGASQDFTLQYCVTGDECKAGNACLPMAANADGSAKGICLPPPPSEGGTGGGGTEPGQPGTGGTAGACFAETWGDPATCQPGVDWALRAVDSCRARGATLVDLHVLLSCNGLPGGAVFTCCQFGDTPVDPPPPPQPECVDLPFPGMGPDMPDPKQMAYDQCSAMGLELRDFRPMDPDASGQPMTWMATCCGPVVQPPPPPTGTCVEMPIPGDPSIDPKEMAWRLCSDQNLVLTDLKPMDTDAAGQVFTWLAVCCGGDVPVEPPPPDPGVCTRIPVKVDPNNPDPAYGDPKMAAYQQCEAMGLQLQDLQPGQPDATGMVWEWIATCCGPVVEPPPPTETCQEMQFTFDCMAAWDWKSAVYERCAAAGGEVRDLKVSDCAADGQGYVYAACCTGAVEPPPPDPGVCTRIPVKVDPNNPDPAYGDPKMAAYQQCEAMGLQLQDLQPGGADSAGNVWEWIATCCGGTVTPPEPPPVDPGCAGQATLTIGDGTCDAAKDWKGEADLQCRIIGGWLQDLQVRYACDDGTIGAVIATCCVNVDPTQPTPVP